MDQLSVEKKNQLSAFMMWVVALAHEYCKDEKELDKIMGVLSGACDNFGIDIEDFKKVEEQVTFLHQVMQASNENDV